jgi:hypothetical protein
MLALNLRRIAHRAASTAAALLTVVSLSACSGNDGSTANSKICADFRNPDNARSGTAGAPSADAAAPVDDCVRRWAYSLAGARDSADVVAGAAVAACGAALTRWNQSVAAAGGPVDIGAPVDSTGAPSDNPLSLVTGQPTNAMAEHSAFAQRQALLYVVEARAGHCKPPPVVKGAPAGVS